MNSTYVITISRSNGSGGRAIGKLLSRELGIPCYDNEIIQMAADCSGISESLFAQADEKAGSHSIFKQNNRVYDSKIGLVADACGKSFTSRDNLFIIQARMIAQLGEKQSCIIIGRAANFILRNNRSALRVNIQAPKDYCVQQLQTRLEASTSAQALKMLEKTNRYRREFYRYYTGHDWNDSSEYDITLNSESLGFAGCADIIIHAAEQKFGRSIRPAPEQEPEPAV